MKKLAIVGSHQDTRHLAPYQDNTFDIWLFNEAPQHKWFEAIPGHRWTAIFQLHKPEVYTSLNNPNHKDHWAWLQQDHGPDKTIWMQDRDERVPNSSRYPLDEIDMSLPALRPVKDIYLTSTVCYAVALALYLGYEYIETWGIDLSSNTEYAYQQPGWLYWAGVAKSVLGDNFKIFAGLHHFEKRLYGFAGETQIDRDWFAQQAAFWEAEKKVHDNALWKCKERLSAALVDRKYKDVAELMVDLQDIAVRAGEAQGAYQTAKECADRDDPISRQQFERHGAQAQQDGDDMRALADKEFGKAELTWNHWMLGNAQQGAMLRGFINQLAQYRYNVGGHMGTMRENFKYMAEYDKRVEAAGGKRTLEALGVNQ